MTRTLLWALQTAVGVVASRAALMVVATIFWWHAMGMALDRGGR